MLQANSRAHLVIKSNCFRADASFFQTQDLGTSVSSSDIQIEFYPSTITVFVVQCVWESFLNFIQGVLNCFNFPKCCYLDNKQGTLEFWGHGLFKENCFSANHVSFYLLKVTVVSSEYLSRHTKSCRFVHAWNCQDSGLKHKHDASRSHLCAW